MSKKITKEMADLAYERGEPILSDAEYDKRFGGKSGKILDKKSPWVKVKHTTPMASLNKVEIIDADNNVHFSNLLKWKKKLDTDTFVALPKYDGAAIVLYYENGKLVKAVTRGDGETGEDVTRNILKAKNVKTKVPSVIKELIAEVTILKSTFNKHLKEEYSNPRNGATGALKDLAGRNAQHLTIKYHGVNYSVETKTFAEKLQGLKALGLKGVKFKVVKNLSKEYKRQLDERNGLDYEVDGMVFVVNDMKLQKKLGRDSSGNPKYAVAAKFPFQRKETTLRAIEFSVGSVGTITPIAVFDSIDLGVNVTRASLANLEKMQELWNGSKPRIGDVIEVSRRGDVIPKVEVVLRRGRGTEIEVVGKCPTCSSATIVDGPMLQCSNEDCEARFLGDLYKWASKIKDHFKVKGLGTERIYEMYQQGIIKRPVDLYRVKPEQIIDVLENVKAKSAANILAYQEHRDIPLDLFLGGLNIPSIGQGVFKFLIDAGYDTLDKIKNMNHTELSAVDNMGEIRAQMIKTWLKKKDKQITELLKEVKIVAVVNEVESEKLAGMSFCITGTLSQPRDHFEDLIKKNGGRIAGVSKNLTYLVAGEAAGSKLAKAKAAGVKIISEKELNNLLI